MPLLNLIALSVGAAVVEIVGALVWGELLKQPTDGRPERIDSTLCGLIATGV